MKEHRLQDDERKAYNQGIDARKEGRTRFANPYEFLSRLGSWWFAGFWDQHKEMAAIVTIKARRRSQMQDGYRL